MARPKAHYSMVIKNHVTGARLKVELVDPPFAEGRYFRVRVNGAWARKDRRAQFPRSGGGLTR